MSMSKNEIKTVSLQFQRLRDVLESIESTIVKAGCMMDCQQTMDLMTSLYEARDAQMSIVQDFEKRASSQRYDVRVGSKVLFESSNNGELMGVVKSIHSQWPHMPNLLVSAPNSTVEQIVTNYKVIKL